MREGGSDVDSQGGEGGEATLGTWQHREEEEEEERRDFPVDGAAELCPSRTGERSDCRDGCVEAGGRDGHDLSVRLKSSSWPPKRTDRRTDGWPADGPRTEPSPRVGETRRHGCPEEPRITFAQFLSTR